MDDKIRNAISQVFEEREAQKQRAEEARNARVTKETENLASFKKIRAEIIRPALQELVDFLAEKGQDAHIIEHDAGHLKKILGAAGGTTGIEIRLCAIEKPAQGAVPAFTFIFDETTGKLRQYVQRPGASGHHGKPVGLDQVSKNWVQEQFTAYFATIGHAVEPYLPRPS